MSYETKLIGYKGVYVVPAQKLPSWEKRKCPECRVWFDMPLDLAEKDIECPKCKAAVWIPRRFAWLNYEELRGLGMGLLGWALFAGVILVMIIILHVVTSIFGPPQFPK